MIGKYLLAGFMCAGLTNAGAQSLTRYVDPYIGSGGHGHVFVGASVPFGAVQAGPANIFKGWDWDSGYNYGDSIMIGFSHLHLNGTGIGDLGDLVIMPYTGDIKTDKGTEANHRTGYSSLYSHRQEQARPGYYSVLLDDYHIKAELTATERTACHQYHFPGGAIARVIVDLKEGTSDRATNTYIEQVDATTFKGYRYSSGWAKDQRVYFAIRTSIPVKQFSVYNEDTLQTGQKGQGKAIKGLMSFDDAPFTLQMKVSISPVSADNALANMQAEVPGWNFHQIIAAADAKWNKELSKIKVETKDEREKRIFYTSLYHTMIDPALFNDVNGDYRGADKQVHEKAPFANYSILSMWDTYRAAHPLYTIIEPERTADMINSMLAIYQQQGKLPIWHLNANETGTMVGISSMQIVAEAYLKGIKGFDINKAYEAVKGTAMGDSLGLMYVKAFKTIPADKFRGSVARALEYGVSDASTALMAKALHHEEDYAYFQKRAKNYKLYYDPETKFFRGIFADGSKRTNFDPMKAPFPDYTEGNAWQYLWLVPGDVPGLIELLGGRDAFTARLDSFFTLQLKAEGHTLADLTGLIGQYAHGNEPGHHIAYLYALAGQPWKTEEKVRYIMKEMYRDQPDGIIGNEDCGQMSAWNVFSSMGFYPVFPASGAYVIGSPAVDKAVIQTPSGKAFTVEAINNSPENIYIQRMELNGKPYTNRLLQHKDLVAGGTLKLWMSKQPNYKL
ncbi:glycoside hydrolase family 92 protein [Chitinophaga agrisoli]|uniref:Glycoside hydrolase family 92 protein n=1 Tax=Chitinophaga agrisoli TaxID=2607653 RepID=A0A5B2VKZ6_9BACT|nr:GH92 family glycosyl hydrolase [Chitinophaga agrisoli]KAA2238927.1 glycoside hydrolase family 92 protein [Chitinophaga agrisoli]